MEQVTERMGFQRLGYLLVGSDEEMGGGLRDEKGGRRDGVVEV